MVIPKALSSYILNPAATSDDADALASADGEADLEAEGEAEGDATADGEEDADGDAFLESSLSSPHALKARANTPKAIDIFNICFDDFFFILHIPLMSINSCYFLIQHYSTRIQYFPYIVKNFDIPPQKENRGLYRC